MRSAMITRLSDPLRANRSPIAKFLILGIIKILLMNATAPQAEAQKLFYRFTEYR
jgi:hypothetical protein